MLKPDGSPGRLFDALGASRATLLFSDETFDELCTRLMRPKFDRYVQADLRRNFLAQLDAITERIGIHGALMGCRDPADDKFLETAVEGQADALVTGDADLLILHPFEGLPILSPSQCLKALAAIRGKTHR